MSKVYIKWTIELVKETTIGFTTRASWRKANRKAYEWAWDHKVLEQVLEHIPKRQPKPKIIKEKGPRKGHPISEETKAKIRAANAKYAKDRPLPEGMHKRKEHVWIEGIESKECSKCKCVKPLDMFGKNKCHKWDGLTYECKVCRNELLKARYRGATRGYYFDYAVKRRRSLKVKCIEYKGNKCQECKINHVKGVNTSIFQFHHRDPTQKDFAVSQINGRNFDNVKPELDKCDMLCANCHHILHWKLNK